MITYKGNIIVIAGPTSSGKSSIALKLSRDINGAIINADSKQVYKELLIGTARPVEKDMTITPHYLYGHISVSEGYNIFKYQRDVNNVLKNLENTKIPILVGGTGLYIDSIVFNYKLKEDDIDPIESEKLNNMSIEELQKIVGNKNLRKLTESDRQNKVRLIRVIQKGNTKIKKGKKLNYLYLVLDIPKEILNRNIEKRVEQMFKDGLVEENIRLRKNRLNKYTSLRTIGYQEFAGYFEKKKSIEEVKKDIILHTKQYAKRQRTWFRRNKDAIWCKNYEEVLENSLKFINT
jgi:tRNA dimethylallyltransferase